MRKLMLLVTLFAVASLGWGVYWYVGASALERELGGWLEKRRASGWVAEATELETRGFPNRFDTTFVGLTLADPDTETAWTAPVFQLLQLSYKPNHVIAVWPGEQRLGLPGQEINLFSDSLIGSFEIDPDPALPLRAATVEAASARFASSRGWKTALGAGQLSMRKSPAPIGPDSYDIYLDATDVVPTDDFLDRLGQRVALPEAIAEVRVSATVAFDKQWDKTAVEQARPQPRKIRLDDVTMVWGELSLRASGTLDVDAEGLPTGDLDVTAQNWREIVAVLEATGKIDRAYVGALTRGLELLAGLKGDPETLDMTLGFNRGWMSIGPVPVMPAPVLALP